jgi:hypothetical protein
LYHWQPLLSTKIHSSDTAALGSIHEGQLDELRDGAPRRGWITRRDYNLSGFANRSAARCDVRIVQGGAIQYYFEKSLRDLVKEGYLREVK